MPTFQPYGDIEEYAVKMFENGGRGIGEKGKDNGLLIVVAVEDRKVGIEVGYGLEGFDHRRLRRADDPRGDPAAFRAGQYGAGLLAGDDAHHQPHRRGPRRARCRTCRATPGRASRAVAGRVRATSTVILFILFIILIIEPRRAAAPARHWGGGPWSGWNSGVGPFGGGFGGFGGGFGGFGGGGGGGGGASAGSAAAAAAAAARLEDGKPWQIR